VKQTTGFYPRPKVDTAKVAAVGQAGGVLLTETVRTAGLDVGLSAGLAPWRKPFAIHDPGKVVLDLALSLALGGDCLADVGVLRAEPRVYELVASDPTVSRTVAALAADAPAALAAIDTARAAARAQVWALAGKDAPDHHIDAANPLVVDLDATLVTSHSDKEPPDFRAGHRGTSRALRREIRAAFERRDAFREVAEADGDRWRRWREDPPETAGEVRARLGVGVERIAGSADANAALRVWIDAVEAAGVLVFQMSRVPVEECRGFALDDADLPVIMLNGADAPQARCFTLVHELAHLLDRTGALCALDEDAEVEQRCNRFAAAVLMPPTAIRDAAAGRDGTGAVEVVVRTFKVSLVAAALRLRELGLVDQATVAATIRLAAAVAGRAAERETSGGPLHHVIKRRNLGDAYLGAVLEAWHQDAITILDASYFLESTVGTVEQMERALAGRPV